MDFWGQQDAARRATWLLTLLLVLASIALVLFTSLLCAIFLGVTESRDLALDQLMSPAHWLQQVPLLWISAIVFITMAGSAIYRSLSLSRGGFDIARELNARLISPDTEEPRERRLIRLVEEVSLGAGATVPPVYVLDHEHSLNAFAAGRQLSDAVIVVTQGAMDHFEPQELEGVFGHEISHIINGDSRIYLRMVSLLYGLTLPFRVGIRMIDVVHLHDMPNDRRDLPGKRSPWLLGLGLCLAGFFSYVLAGGIRAAICRHREYLADASAVQFTRNHEGLANALRRIGGHELQGYMVHPKALEFAHLFIAEADLHSLLKLFSTHPPLPERIRRLWPRWDGSYLKEASVPVVRESLLETPDKPREDLPDIPYTPQAVITAALIAGTELMDREERENAPVQSDNAAPKSPSVGDIDYTPVATPATGDIATGASDPVARLLPRLHHADEVGSLLQQIIHRQGAGEALSPQQRYEATSLALPTLLQLPRNERRELYFSLRQSSDESLSSDRLTSMLLSVLLRDRLRRLDDVAYQRRQQFPLGRQKSRDAIATVLAGLCQLSGMSNAQQQDAWQQAMSDSQQLLTREDAIPPVSQQGWEAALVMTCRLAPKWKAILFSAACRCAGHDDEITQEEAQYLRVLALMLDCPLPDSVKVTRPQRWR
ncbi:M48 family metalloprotease [Pokkaliibacter sp. CJK22405]|uniref:M48 family metalloprotease n=1 Tax=Pokkaliibacter sp. CJK22405 TaxID=3384615 RepID=UPI0039848C30